MVLLQVVIEGRTTQDLNLSSEKIPDVFVRELVHSVARRLLPLGAAQLMVRMKLRCWYWLGCPLAIRNRICELAGLAEELHWMLAKTSMPGHNLFV